MPDVRMPDGTIIKNVPGDISQQELLRRLQLFQSRSNINQPQRQGFTPEGQFVAGALPPRQSDAPSREELSAFARGAIDRALNTGIRGLEQLQIQRPVRRPAPPGLDLPKADITGEMRQQFPSAVRGGEVAADIALLLAGRAPIARRLSAPKTPATAPTLQPGVRRLLDRTFRSDPVQNLLRATGRSAETGFEGAVLAMLDEGDPVELAAFSAGEQMVGSGLLGLGKGLVSGGVLRAGAKLGIAAASIGALVQTFKTVSPGGRDFILESLETGFDKVVLGLTAGAVAGAAGAGRLRGTKFAEDVPIFADVLTGLPRAGVLATIREALADEQVEETLIDLSQNPARFSKSSREAIERAIQDPDISLGETIRGFQSSSRQK